MTIISTLPVNLQNGTLEDATQVMSNFNWIVSQVNANAVGPGANSTITSLSGLTTALSVSQGGTGAAIAATALSNLGGLGAANNLSELTNPTTALVNLGLGAKNAASGVVVLDASSRLPAVDGSQLTGIITVPTGTIIDFAGTSAPTGYLTCPTTATNISRTTYAALFAAIGTTWGAGDGSTTFGMPWFPADYASVQANANVGSSTIGQVLSHTHSGVVGTAAVGNVAGGGSTVCPTGNAGIGTTGGSANLPAGVRVLKCVKY